MLGQKDNPCDSYQQNIIVCFNIVYTYIYIYCNTVDGYNPAPPDMYKTLQIMGQAPNLNWLAGFLPSTVCDYKTVKR